MSRRWARDFHASRNLQVVKPVLLADIGEGKCSRDPVCALPVCHQC